LAALRPGRPRPARGRDGFRVRARLRPHPSLDRIHAAIVAHAAATCACLLPGRFFLGLSTGENLNEHVLGDRWPAADERIEMPEESIEVVRLLWQGGERTHRGKHYTVDHCRICDLPDEPVELAIAAGQPVAAELAGRLGDALVSTAPDSDVVEKFEQAGGNAKPEYGMLHVCCGEDEDAGFDHVFVHQIGPDQEAFFRFYESEILARV
jgi:G6PDH family F420-dependent oxidoreductase